MIVENRQLVTNEPAEFENVGKLPITLEDYVEYTLI